jgi:DNA-binding response OmpR family regulator
MLDSAGYHTILSHDFNDARVDIELRSPSVLVIDVRLGAFNGMHLGLLARRHRPDVKIVFVSGWDDTVLRRTADEIGAAYLRKPLAKDTLLSACASGHAA